MNRLARELLRRGKGPAAAQDLPRSLEALCLSPVRTITQATVRTRARSAGGLLVKDNKSKLAPSIDVRVNSRTITGECGKET